MRFRNDALTTWETGGSAGLPFVPPLITNWRRRTACITGRRVSKESVEAAMRSSRKSRNQ
ncbi:hypothetical protein KIF59_20965 [Enterobacter cloacae subsp. cloacae]|nr:hypothetical protein [Enterobacter cloacae subsp. cloacae]